MQMMISFAKTGAATYYPERYMTLIYSGDLGFKQPPLSINQMHMITRTQPENFTAMPAFLFI
ncbi:hypothetical protein D9M68_548410 [compost metagenome]